METPALVADRPARDLRPMGIAALLDEGIYFYRVHFLALLAYTGLFTIPSMLLTVLLSLSPSGMMFMDPTIIERQPEIFAATTLVSGLGSVLLSLGAAYFIFPLQAAGVAVALREFLLVGRRVTLREMLGGLRANLRPLLVTGFVAMIFSLLLGAALIIPPVGLAVMTLFWFAFYLAVFVVVYEKREGLDALRRGWILVRGSVWRVLGYLLVFYLFSVIMGSAFGLLLGAASAALTVFVENPLLGLVFQLLAGSLVTVLTTPIVLTVVGLLYFDLRIRHEGLDVAIAASGVEVPALDLAALPASDAPVMNEVTWRAIGILSAVYTGVFALFCGCVIALIALAGGLASLTGG